MIPTGKTYYWLKLKADFFNSKEIRKLRNIAGGAEYVLIYQEMLIYSLPENGFLYFDGFESDISAELALVLGAKVADVQVVVSFLLKFGLMEQVDDVTFRLTQVEEMTGRESDSAARVRKHRDKMANLSENGEKTLHCNGRALLCNTNVTKCNTEIDIEKEIEKDKEIERDKREKSPASSAKKKKPERHKYGEYKNVLLSDEELDKLKSEIPEYTEYIDRLSGYMQSTGRTYKDHLATIRNWRRADLKKQTARLSVSASDKKWCFDPNQNDDLPY